MALTPMMQQYLEVKEKNSDCILFFRLGDFYEMFFEDAETASRELELVLTGRDCGLEQRAPMCGIPYHAANNYISRLISRGYKVAICEQMEDPSVAKGIVRRDVIKIITPGTFLDSNFIEDNKNNYIMCLFVDKSASRCGICFTDISTGEVYSTDFTYDVAIILDEISKFSPREALFQKDIDEEIVTAIKERFKISITVKEDNYFTEKAEFDLSTQFKTVKIETLHNCLIFATHGILNYIVETQKQTLSNITLLEYYSINDFMSIDLNTRRNLELTETIRDKSKKGSLLWVLDKTNTAMGSRMLRKWIEQPLVNKRSIEQRLDAVEELTSDLSLLEDLKVVLKGVYDIERIVGKISSKAVNAKELIALKQSIHKIPGIKDCLRSTESELLLKIFEKMDSLEDIYTLLESSLLDSPALSVKEGNIIKDGYNSEVDDLRQAKSHGKEWIAELENKEREATGIRSLKVGYNKVFGYYVEISKANYSSIPEGRYIRKQTLSNAERFITEDLKIMEEKILGAEEKLIFLEYQLFSGIREFVESHIERLKITAQMLSELDCLCSLSSSALEYNYVKPQINTEGSIVIEEGRHPVVEKVIPNGAFISNDTCLNNSADQLLIITGPNMAGKSTYMRQVALITILAQIGSFVPAKKAQISICDKVFTRIGASDDLAAGKSTFMVEMWEVANILNNATSESLVLLDEVGRGTSTYDGLSIAWAVIEYICNNAKLKCKTLFATHYHELTKLEGIIEGVKNYCVSVKEIGNEIVFLRKIIRGGADQSYGIEVAKLAGLPEVLINRAKKLLSSLENDGSKDILPDEIAVGSESFSQKPVKAEVSLNEPSHSHESTKALKSQKSGSKAKVPDGNVFQLDFNDLEKNNLIKEISFIDVMNMTPLESMNKLYELIKKARCLN